MFVIEKVENGEREILMMMFNEGGYTAACNWAINYISTDIQSLLLCPYPKQTTKCEYFIKPSLLTFELVKSVVKVKRGYIYNTCSKEQQSLYTINVRECTKSKTS